jgi:hypothetical protein
MTYVLIIMLFTGDGPSMVAVPGFATAQLCEHAAQAVEQHRRDGLGYRIILHACVEHSPSKVEAERSEP